MGLEWDLQERDAVERIVHGREDYLMGEQVVSAAQVTAEGWLKTGLCSHRSQGTQLCGGPGRGVFLRFYNRFFSSSPSDEAELANEYFSVIRT